MIVPVILSGGSGSRLWPLSRESHPKQFLALAGEHTLLQQTAQRVLGLDGVTAPLLVCNEDHRFMAAEQLREIGVRCGAIILEPVGRNTAPAIAVAALQALELYKDPTLLVLPADHLVADPAAFRRAALIAAAQAAADRLVTFGVRPASAETGYGYIRAGEQLTDNVYKVDAFVEKPDRHTARQYLEGGGYFWNSGMFAFRARRYLDELERYAPEMLAASSEAHAAATADLDFLRLDKHTFVNCPANSIDYAVMEKTTASVVTPLDAGWSDVGVWSALRDAGRADGDGNVCRGDVVVQDARNCYAHADGRLLALLGVDGLIVVETPDAVLVAAADRVQKVKQLVDRLRADGRSEGSSHRKVYRPWGAYDSIDVEPRFQVKRITVNPGASLSLQMHHHRAEHWIVVRGTAKITRDDETFLLTENESTFIPLGSRHRLANPGRIPLELIEVQSGSYLGEDDIVRFDDVYGRDEAPA